MVGGRVEVVLRRVAEVDQDPVVWWTRQQPRRDVVRELWESRTPSRHGSGSLVARRAASSKAELRPLVHRRLDESSILAVTFWPATRGHSAAKQAGRVLCGHALLLERSSDWQRTGPSDISYVYEVGGVSVDGRKPSRPKDHEQRFPNPDIACSQPYELWLLASVLRIMDRKPGLVWSVVRHLFLPISQRIAILEPACRP